MYCPSCGAWNRSGQGACSACAAALPAGVVTAAEPSDAHVNALRQATGNRYHVVSRLGTGGMADVYLARHARLRRPLAIKMLHRHLARDAEMRERFRREAEAASRLVHPAIAGILDYGESGEVVWIVLPYLSGGSLADQLAKASVVPPGHVARVAAEVACGLDYAHRHGVVHRDVKPDNILFDDDGHAVLTDFGIATAQFHVRLTAHGRAMGTPHYMSPEQAMGRLADGRSDLYALGVTMYESLAGFPPFDGADAYSIGHKHVHEAAVAPHEVQSSVPPVLSAIVMRCLEKDPAARFARGHDLADALLAWLGEQPGARAARAAGIARSLPTSTTPV